MALIWVPGVVDIGLTASIYPVGDSIPACTPFKEPDTLPLVNQLLRVMLLVLLLSPSASQALRPVEEVCAEERDGCCEPSGACDVDCVQCACCAARAVTFQCAEPVESLDGVRTTTATAPVATPPSAPAFDILHIPKSV